MAVIIGGLIVIWLGLGMGAAVLRWLGIELHYPARLAAPLLLALLETLLFLLFVPGTDLLADQRRGQWFGLVPQPAGERIPGYGITPPFL